MIFFGLVVLLSTAVQTFLTFFINHLVCCLDQQEVYLVFLGFKSTVLIARIGNFFLLLNPQPSESGKNAKHKESALCKASGIQNTPIFLADLRP